MRVWLSAVVVLLLLTANVRSEDRPTFDSLWREANGKPDHQTTDDGHSIRIAIPSERVIYFFTKPGQAEHPGVFKRSVVQNGSAIAVQTQGWSFGDSSAQSAFQKVLDGFKAQDAEMSRRMSAKP